MYKLIRCLFCCLVFTTNILTAQKQNNQWRFGYQSGVSFQAPSPVSVAGAALITQEGSASVANKNTGNLLFYTDGITVWNALNQAMPNGFGLFGGSPSLLSSTTAAAILPKPGSSTQYYIFTIDEQYSSGNGLRYTLVDMALNGGLGDVIANQKNIPIWQTESEKIEIVPAANPASYWVITHDNPGNTFFSFLVDANGVQTTPVVSVIGGNHGNGSGHLKINRQFNRLACGNLFDGTIELYNFNNATGELSNFVSLNFNFPNASIYGVEFSPNGQFLYITNLDRIIQYNISLGTPTAIEASAYVLAQNPINQPATLQLGPDSIIYCNAGLLTAITQPNNAGPACNYNPNGLPAGGYGLPKWVYGNHTSATITRTIAYTDSCAEQATLFSLSDTTGIQNVTWNFGNPAAGITNNATGLFPSHTYALPGTYTVTAIVTSNNGIDTISLPNLTIVDCTPILCEGNINVNGTLCLSDTLQWSIQSTRPITNVLWQFDNTGNNTSTNLNPSMAYSIPGSYTVRCIVTFDCGIDTLTKTIIVTDCDTVQCPLFIPNVFSPNNDGLNDVFTIKQNCFTEYWELAVFNRWGERVFYSDSPTVFWDGFYKGLESPVGAYFYVLKYKFNRKKLSTTAGDILLLR